MQNNRIYVLGLIPVAALYAFLYAAFALSNLQTSFLPNPDVGFGPYVMPKLEAIFLGVRAVSGVVLLLAMIISLKRSVDLVMIACGCFIVINVYNIYNIWFFMNDARALDVNVFVLFHPFLWVEYLLDVAALISCLFSLFQRFRRKE